MTEPKWKKEFLKIAKGGSEEKLAQALLLIERTLAAREKEVRDGIAKEIEKQMAAEGAEGEFLFGVDKGLQVAANIARKHD
jgi:hypothetical protein